MARVALDRVSKVYPNWFRAIEDLTLEAADGEFLVLVGPSGCGKSTALRMIAGLESITAGTLRIGDRLVNRVEPKDRDIAMVFQDYALYPHMTVAENIGFALKLARVPKHERRQRVAEAARILELTEQLDKRPGALSGGQRQRVAMGRAIVRKPAVFLMDEPLSNLDAKLRVQMRTEVVRLQSHLGTTTIYVTHDQTEAMTMGHRVAVLKDGRLQQVDTPQHLYDRPANVFVAAFIGSPSMNLFAAVLSGPDESGDPLLHLGSHRFAVPAAVAGSRPGLAGYREVIVGIRPEDISDASLTGGDGPSLPVTINQVEALGSELIVYFHLDARTIDAGDPDAADESILREANTVARLDPRSRARAGEELRLTVDPLRLHFFDPATGRAIG